MPSEDLTGKLECVSCRTIPMDVPTGADNVQIVICARFRRAHGAAFDLYLGLILASDLLFTGFVQDCVDGFQADLRLVQQLTSHVVEPSRTGLLRPNLAGGGLDRAGS